MGRAAVLAVEAISVQQSVAFMLTIVLVCILIGAALRLMRGGSFATGALLGLIAPVGWAIALLWPVRKPCPACRKGVHPQATLCPYCRTAIPLATRST